MYVRSLKMPLNRTDFTLYLNSTTGSATVPIIVPSYQACPSTNPFAVVRFDRRTKARAYSQSEDSIFDLIEEAWKVFEEGSDLSLSRKYRHYVKRLIRLGLDRDRTERIIHLIKGTVSSAAECTDVIIEKIVTILHDVHPPITKPARPMKRLPLEHFRREFAKCGWDTRVLIEGPKKTLVLLDPLHQELARFIVRDGDEVYAVDVVHGMGDAERPEKQSHS
jgi:hypothetical protein